MTTVYEQLAANVLAQDSKLIPRLFAMIVSESEAALLLAMPGNSQYLAEKTGMAPDEVARMLRELFNKGVAFYSGRTDPPTWRMCRDLVQFHDASILWPEAPAEFLDLWREYMDTEWLDFAEVLGKMLPQPVMRIIPVDKSVDAKHQVLAFEDVKEIVDKGRRIAVVKCPCRLSAKKCDAPLEACIQFNRAADYAIERGTGREIDKAEALKIVKECEEAGLVHLTINKKSVDHVICNCCSCCCINMPALLLRGVSLSAPSRFRASVDEEECIACGDCVESCWVRAISLNDAEDFAVVDEDKCLGCGICVSQCPTGAISLHTVRDESTIPD